MKLALIIHALTAGGAERVMSILANAWAAQGREIDLITLDDGSLPPFFPLDGRIRHQRLGQLRQSRNLPAALLNNGKRLLALRRAIRAANPDAVISFLDSTNVLTLLATRGLGLPVIVSEHIDPSQYHIKPAWRLLRRAVYPMADRVVVLTERVRAFFPRRLQGKLAVIPNPVVLPPEGAARPPVLPPGPWLAALGRLTEQKGFDLLLDAFATLAGHQPGWRLAILGEGPLRQDLEARIEHLGLQGRVWLTGQVDAPEAFLRQADLFVLPSRFEGFPMALCEAMALGLAVVAADCPTGPREIIRDGLDGCLVPAEDPAALAAALEQLMTQADLRARLARRAPEILQRFGLPQVLSRWDALLRPRVRGT